jgi:hypothetical protein
MLAAQRYYFIALAVFLVLVSFTFFFFRQDEPAFYEKIAKVPYRYTSRMSQVALTF